MDINFCPYCMNPLKEGEACTVCGLKEGAYTPKGHHLPLGTVLQDRYLIGRVLGEGGFGITYIGRDLRLDMKVAVKEYYPTDKGYRYSQASLRISPYAHAQKSFQTGRERFLKEAQTMALLEKQPNIVSARDFFEENDTAYIVMEYVEGTTLKELVSQRGGRIPEEELFDLLKPLFPALESVHELGLIHRDISPDNLMLEKGRIRLLDFGCARDTNVEAQTLTVALKQGYAPVEQYQQKGQGTWTDVYALSATIYYCLTGKTLQSAVDRLDEDEIVLPRQLGVKLSPEREEALMKGLEINYHKRYQTVKELYKGLYQEKHPAAGKKRMAVILAAVGAAFFLAATAGIIYLVFCWQENSAKGSSGEIAAGNSSLEDLFADAAVLESFSREKLQDMLADDSIKAVRIAEGNYFSNQETAGQITVTKPLLIESGVRLSLFDMLTIRGEDACVWVRGCLSGTYDIRTMEGGRIIVDEGAELYGNFIWLEDVRDLETWNEDAIQFNKQILGSMESRFQGAAKVKDEQELRRAAEDGGDIVVAGKIVLQDSLDVHFSILVKEGASLSAEGEIALNLKDGELWNQGEISLRVNMQEGRGLINEGKIQSDLSIRDSELLLNLGEITLKGDSSMEGWLFIYNMGELTFVSVGGDQRFNLDNFGSLVFRENQKLYLTGGTWIRNFGNLVLEDGVRLVNRNYLCNDDDGRIFLQSGAVWDNQGIIRVNAGEIQVEEGAEFQNENGAVIYLYPEENIPVKNGVLTVLHKGDAFELDISTMDVDNVQDLKEMLASPYVKRIRISGSIQWPEEILTIDKEVEVCTDSILTLEKGAELVVDGGILLNNSYLQTDRMTICRGGSFVNNGEFDMVDADSLLRLDGGQEESSDGTVSFENDGTCDLKGGLLEIFGKAAGCNFNIMKGASFQIGQSGCFIQLGQMMEWTAGGTMRLSGGGEFRDLVYENCDEGYSFDVQEGGRLFFSAGAQISGGSLLLAPGAFVKISGGYYDFCEGMSFINEGRTVLENCTINLQNGCTNRGSMEISGSCEIHLSGKTHSSILDNQGEIRVLPQEDISDPLALYMEYGELTGNDIVYESDAGVH